MSSLPSSEKPHNRRKRNQPAADNPNRKPQRISELNTSASAAAAALSNAVASSASPASSSTYPLSDEYAWLFPGATVRFAACFKSKISSSDRRRGAMIQFNRSKGVVQEITTDGMVKVLNTTYPGRDETAQPRELRKALPAAGQGVVFVYHGEHRGKIGYLIRRTWQTQSLVRLSRHTDVTIEVDTTDLIGINPRTTRKFNSSLDVSEWIDMASMREFQAKLKPDLHNSDSAHSETEDDEDDKLNSKVDMSSLRYLLLHGNTVIFPKDAPETFEWSMRANLRRVLVQQNLESGNDSGFIHNFKAFTQEQTYVLLLDRESVATEEQKWIFEPRYKHLIISGNERFLLVAYAVMSTTQPDAISLFDSVVHGKGFAGIFLEKLRAMRVF